MDRLNHFVATAQAYAVQVPASLWGLCALVAVILISIIVSRLTLRVKLGRMQATLRADLTKGLLKDVSSVLLQVETAVSAQRDGFAKAEQQIADLQARVELLSNGGVKDGATRTQRSSGDDLEPVGSAGPVRVTAAHEADQISAAIMANRIDLYLQPTVELPSRRVRFHECLSRLRDEDGKTLFPAAFLRHAHDRDLMSSLDNFLLLRGVQIARRLGARPGTSLLFLNIAGASLRDPVFYGQFIDFMTSAPDLSRHLVFEIEQNELRDVPSNVAAGLEKLAKCGFAFCIDNVNADAAAQLGDLAKIAGYFKVPTQVLLGSDGQQIRAAAEATNAQIIASRVEDEKSVIDLIETAIPFAQGYAISAPRVYSDDMLHLRGAA